MTNSRLKSTLDDTSLVLICLQSHNAFVGIASANGNYNGGYIQLFEYFLKIELLPYLYDTTYFYKYIKIYTVVLQKQ